MDEDKFYRLYDHAISVKCAVDLKKSEICKIMDINSIDYRDNFDIINKILIGADNEKKG
jgi:hypothetical protein